MLPNSDFKSLKQSLKVTLSYSPFQTIAYMSALPRTSEQFRMSLWSSGGAAPGPRKPPRLLQHGDQTASAKVNTGGSFLDINSSPHSTMSNQIEMFKVLTTSDRD